MKAAAVLKERPAVSADGARMRIRMAALDLPDERVFELMEQVERAAYHDCEIYAPISFDELNDETKRTLIGVENGTEEMYGPFDTWADAVADMRARDAAEGL